MKNAERILLCLILLTSITSAQTFWQKTNTPENLVINSFLTGLDGEIFIATNNGIYKSTDDGEVWEEKSSGLASKEVNNIIKDLDNNLIAGTKAGLFKSTNKGDEWIELNIGLSLTDVKSLAIKSDGKIFIGAVDSQYAYPGTIYLYSGENIVEEIDEGLIGEDLAKDFLIDNNDSIFALTNGGGVIQSDFLYRWEDNNHQWAEVYRFSPVLEITGMIKNKEDTLFATNNNGLIKSMDKGFTWLPADLYPNNVLSVIAETDTSLFAGTYYLGTSGVYYSTNNGVTWESKDEGLENIPVVSFAFNDEGYLFAGTYMQGVYKSRDILTGISNVDIIQKPSFLLNQNFPNPFNPTTKIEFQIADFSLVTLKVYDSLGKEVRALVNGEIPAGKYEIEFDASGLTSGIYFYQLRTGNYVANRKMILLK